jgi:hypothetical protein
MNICTINFLSVQYDIHIIQWQALTEVQGIPGKNEEMKSGETFKWQGSN